MPPTSTNMSFGPGVPITPFTLAGGGVPPPPANGLATTPFTPSQAAALNEIQFLGGASLAAETASYIAGFNVGSDIIDEAYALSFGQNTAPFSNQVETDLMSVVISPISPLAGPLTYATPTQGVALGSSIQQYYAMAEQSVLLSLPPGTLPPNAPIL